MDAKRLVIPFRLPVCQLDYDRLRRHRAYHRGDPAAGDQSALGYQHGHALHLRRGLAFHHRPLLHHGQPESNFGLFNRATSGANLLQRLGQVWWHRLHRVRLHHHQVRLFHRNAGSWPYRLRILP